MRKLQRAALAQMLMVGAVWAQLPNPKPGWNLFSKQQDIQLGQEAASQVERQMQVLRDAPLTDFVTRIGQRLANTGRARESGFPFTFKVINDQSINAFALPGGPMFIHTGLLRAVENEAQLAGVMGHEMSHVILRHGTNQATKAQALQLPAILLGSVAGRGGSMLGSLGQLGLGLGFNSVLLKFSRSAERDADLLGAQLMSEAGFNPIEMARFFEKLEQQGSSHAPQFLSDHPNPGNRVKYVEDEIRYLPSRQYDAESGQLPQIQARLSNFRGQGTPLRRLGAETPSMRPAGTFRTFEGQSFSVAYPSTWEVFGERQGGTVTIAPREGLGRSRDGGTAIGYGAMVSFYQPPGDQLDLSHDTADLVRQLQASNPSLQGDPGSVSSVRVGGKSGLLTVLRSVSPFEGEPERDLLLTVARPEGLFYMVLIAPESEFNQVQAQLQRMIESVRFPN